MRIALAVLAVLAALVVGVAAFALLNLRALIGAQHDRLVTRIASVVGRPTDVGVIAPSWWPLGVRLRDVAVGEDPAFGTEPFLRADGVVMRVRAWPLVHGRIEIAGVTLERPRVALVRDAGRWNVESLGAAEGEHGSKSKESRFSLRVPLEWVVGVALTEVRDGTLTIEDRRGRRPVRFVLGRVRGHAEDVRFGATARMRIEAALFDGPAVDAHLDIEVPALGQNDAQHSPFTAHLEIQDADLGKIGATLGDTRRTAGRLRRIVADAAGTLERARTTVEVASDDPSLRIGNVPFGRAQPLAVHATLAHARDAVTIEDARAMIGTLEVRAHGEASVDPPKVALDVASASGGVATIVLDQANIGLRALEGRVALDREGVELAPLALEADEVPLRLKGWITAADPPVFDLHVESRPCGWTVAADVALDAGGDARARLEAAGVDLAPAVARFAPELAGRVEGSAQGAAVLTARVVGTALTSGSLTGSGTLTVTHGRLREVNVPNLVVDQIERIPFMPTLVSPATRARYAELFASDDTVVESASLPFTIARGRFSTEHAVVVNAAYQVTGDGWIDEARALRFRGTVLLGASVSRTLRDDVRAVKYLMEDDGRVALPFYAHGRLGAVRVEPDAKRLHTRSLDALLGGSADGSTPAPGEHKRDGKRHENEVDHMIDRLQKWLRP